MAGCVVVGCGTVDDASPTPDDPAPTTSTAEGSDAPEVDPAGSDEPAERLLEPAPELQCEQPTPPVESVDQHSGSEATLPDLDGGDLFVGPTAPGPTDSDGDGVPDEIVSKQVVDDPAVIERGDGRLVFEQPGMVASINGVEDLDGDGRDELVVSVSDADHTGPGPAERSYLVPGSTPAGTHDPAEVGVRLAAPVFSIEDRDGDGAAELVEYDGTAPTRVLSGAEVIAVGPGGDARDLVPLFGLPGVLQGFAVVGGPSPALVTGEPDMIHIGDEDGMRSFTTAPEPWVGGYGSLFGGLRIIDATDGRHLELSQADRSSARAYRWSLDAPCPEG